MPWDPKDDIDPWRRSADRVNPFRTADVNPRRASSGTYVRRSNASAPAVPAGAELRTRSRHRTRAGPGPLLPSPPYARYLRDGGSDKFDQNFSQDELAWNRGASQQQTKELKEAYLELEMLGGALFLRLGRQTIVWGKTELFATTDLFNPNDLALGSLTSSRNRASRSGPRAPSTPSTRSVRCEDVRLEAGARPRRLHPARPRPLRRGLHAEPGLRQDLRVCWSTASRASASPARIGRRIGGRTRRACRAARASSSAGIASASRWSTSRTTRSSPTPTASRPTSATSIRRPAARGAMARPRARCVGRQRAELSAGRERRARSTPPSTSSSSPSSAPRRRLQRPRPARSARRACSPARAVPGRGDRGQSISQLVAGSPPAVATGIATAVAFTARRLAHPARLPQHRRHGRQRPTGLFANAASGLEPIALTSGVTCHPANHKVPDPGAGDDAAAAGAARLRSLLRHALRRRRQPRSTRSRRRAASTS